MKTSENFSNLYTFHSSLLLSKLDEWCHDITRNQLLTSIEGHAWQSAFSIVRILDSFSKEQDPGKSTIVIRGTITTNSARAEGK